VIKTRDEFSLFGLPGNGRIECRLQDQFGLLECIQLTKVPEKLNRLDAPSTKVAVPESAAALTACIRTSG
jgi:hypothetical protein